MSRLALSVREYAEAIGTKCLWRIYQAIANGEIPTVHLPGVSGIRIPAQWVIDKCGGASSSEVGHTSYTSASSVRNGVAMAGGGSMGEK